jgi:hypothetical protein
MRKGALWASRRTLREMACAMTIREVELDHAFAEAVEADKAFQRWVVAGGRFSRFADEAVLLIEEQRTARASAKHWWKHWWCRLPDGSESETDVFLVFEVERLRFALHIENKPPHGKLGMRQAADYRRRAAFMANEERWLNYADFETLLLAPAAFLAANPACASQFDRTLAYEEVGRFVPKFALAE